MAVILNPLEKRFRVDPFKGLLPRRIDIGKHQVVHLRKSREKVFKQNLSATKPMGLKDHYQPSIRPNLFHCVEGDFDLRGMVAVIVNNNDSIRFTLNLKAPLYSAKFFNSLLYAHYLYPQLPAHGYCR